MRPIWLDVLCSFVCKKFCKDTFYVVSFDKMAQRKQKENSKEKCRRHKWSCNAAFLHNGNFRYTLCWSWSCNNVMSTETLDFTHHYIHYRSQYTLTQIHNHTDSTCTHYILECIMEFSLVPSSTTAFTPLIKKLLWNYSNSFFASTVACTALAHIVYSLIFIQKEQVEVRLDLNSVILFT